MMLSLGLDAGQDVVHGEYRKLLYTQGAKTGIDEAGKPVRAGFSPEELQEVLDDGGRLSLQQALHCRVRYFTDGLVLGSQVYVDDAFYRYRARFSPKRAGGARKVMGADLGDLCTARRLQSSAITVPRR